MPFFPFTPKKTTSITTLCRADLSSNGQTTGKNKTRFKGPWRPSFFKPNPAVFWQTGRYYGTYFHVLEPDGIREGFRTGTRQSEPELGPFSLMFSTPESNPVRRGIKPSLFPHPVPLQTLRDQRIVKNQQLLVNPLIIDNKTRLGSSIDIIHRIMTTYHR